jgi:hypothetical protein
MTPTLAPALLPGARGCIDEDDDGRAVYQFEAISPKIVPSNRAEAMRAEPVCCAQRLSDNASHALTRDGPRVFLSSWLVRRGRRPRPRRMPRSSTRAPRTRAPRVGRSQFASDYRDRTTRSDARSGSSTCGNHAAPSQRKYPLCLIESMCLTNFNLESRTTRTARVSPRTPLGTLVLKSSVVDLQISRVSLSRDPRAPIKLTLKTVRLPVARTAA